MGWSWGPPGEALEPFWCPGPPRTEKGRKSDFMTPPGGQVGSPFWHIFAAKSFTNEKNAKKTSSKNAP